MLHRVGPKDDTLQPISELKISPEYLEKFIISKINDYDFVSIDELSERILNHKKYNKKFIAITFDDGYEDNYEYAYPILKKFNVPFCIYLSVNLLKDQEVKRWNYPFILEKIIRINDHLILGDGVFYSCKTNDEKIKLFRLLRNRYFSSSYENVFVDFNFLFSHYLTNDVFDEDTLSWSQIECMSKDPLCLFGSHTMSHCRLNFSNEQYLEYELQNSKHIIESHINKKCLHISYPYGSKDDVCIEAVDYINKIGYKTGMISHGGPIRKFDNNLNYIKRIMLIDRQ